MNREQVQPWRPRGRHPLPTVDVIIETDGGLVLVRRKYPPLGWSLPGGFIDEGESPEAAAAREAKEETGLEISVTGQFRAYGDPARDPRGHTITIVYTARASGRPRGGDDAAAAAVFPLDALPGDLTFDHRRIIGDWLDARPGNTDTDATARTIAEPARELPVSGTCDVLVAGGGIAGVAAAVAAAREGASVCLVERTFGLGGLATLGNVIVWLPICDGHGRQVIAGLPEELLRLSVADLGADNSRAQFLGVPPGWQPGGDPAERLEKRYRVSFNPAAYLVALEELVLGSGITLLYDTRVCATRRTGGRISHLLIENKSGRSALAGRVVIDATGDADVCCLAAEETASLDTNVLCGWFYHLDGAGLHLHKLSNRYHRQGLAESTTGPLFRGDRAPAVTAHMTGSRALMQQKLAQLRAAQPESDIQPVMIPSIPCFRMTRRLVGAMELGERHMHRWFADTVGLTGDWRRAGPVYAVPRRALAGRANRNLLAAGRCISADNSAWDVTRAIPACAMTGTAAGVIAALAAAEAGGDVHAPPDACIQQRLRAKGALLDPSLVKKTVLKK